MFFIQLENKSENFESKQTELNFGTDLLKKFKLFANEQVRKYISKSQELPTKKLHMNLEQKDKTGYDPFYDPSMMENEVAEKEKIQNKLTFLRK